MNLQQLPKYVLKFGKYKGKALEDVRASYLLWLYDEGCKDKHVQAYVERERKHLEAEAAERKKRNESEE